jgi:cytoskeletal protein RodZ
MKAGFVTVGETLSHARRARGLSVDDVAADTRIRATLIHAIEADNFDPCGGAVYARGHIRSIARVVGVDAGPLISEFDQAHGVEPAVQTVAAQPTDHSIVARSERHQPNWTAAMAAALVVICALALVGLLHHGGGSKKPPESSTVAVGQPKATPKPRSSPPPSSVAELPSTQATLKIRTLHGQTWLSITTKSGKTLYSGLLADGQQKVFTSRHSIAYVIGNAPAVDVVVNGNDIGSPPASGSVARGNVKPGADTVQQA